MENLCAKYDIDYGKTKEWYNGYLIGDFHIYNPQAVTELMDSGAFRSYWTGTAYYINPLLKLPSGKGFADVVYLPKRDMDKPALVVELKWNQSAKGVIVPIKDKQYTDWLEGYTGKILLIGISYDKKKGHTCVIEEYKKSE